MKIKLNGDYYADFTDFAYEQSLDSIASSFSFACRFDETNREIFRPLSFIKVEFFDDNEVLFFTGTAVSHGFESNSEINLIQISGYSLPGVLEDCTVPYGNYSLENNNMSLSQIIRKLIKPFGLELIVSKGIEQEASKNYSKSSPEPEDMIKEYISKLTSQRNLILSHDEKGRVILFRPDAKAKPVLFFNNESAVQMSFDISGQSMHSEITNLRQPKAKKAAKKKKTAEADTGEEDALGYPIDMKTPEPKPPKKKQPKEKPVYHDTHKNPLIKAFRPIVKILSEGEDYDTKAASRNQFADELKNIKLDITAEEWMDVKPGQIVRVQNEEIYLKEAVNLMVMQIKKTENPEGREMTISVVIPEAFTGETPKNIFS